MMRVIKRVTPPSDSKRRMICLPIGEECFKREWSLSAMYSTNVLSLFDWTPFCRLNHSENETVPLKNASISGFCRFTFSSTMVDLQSQCSTNPTDGTGGQHLASTRPKSSHRRIKRGSDKTCVLQVPWAPNK